ncbi:MAG: hypothetical protein HKN68_10820 [Saprospiraceae bacterium]|nr:hypothetical protein [Saprospiraceae bacterium]
MSLSLILQAQVLSVNEVYNPSSSTDEIYIDSEYGSMEIVMASVSEIKVEGTVMINMGNGNEAYSISGNQEGNTFVINTELEEDGLEEMMILKKKDGTKKIIIKDKGKSININDHDDDTEGWQYMNYGYDVEIDLTITIPRGKKVKVRSEFGAVKAVNLDRDVDIKCTYSGAELVQDNIRNGQRIDVISTYSHVDVTMPSSSTIDLKLRTDYGKIYSNHEINVDLSSNRDVPPHGDQVIVKMNGGGSKVTLKSDYSNIYFRKTS